MTRFNYGSACLLVAIVGLSVLGCVTPGTMTSREVVDPSESPTIRQSDYSGQLSVDDSTKAEIIMVWLKRLSKKDHVISDDNSVYLIVSEETYSALPKSVNGIEVKRYLGSTIIGENDVPYIEFDRWSRRENSVWVTGIAYFVGGNTGGCREQYDWTRENNWKSLRSECFATAS